LLGACGAGHREDCGCEKDLPKHRPLP
jgi:hypothetical protein